MTNESGIQLVLESCPNSFGCTINDIGYIAPGSNDDLGICKSYTCTCSGETRYSFRTRKTTYSPCHYFVSDIGGYLTSYDTRRCEVVYKEPCYPTAVLKRNHNKGCPGGVSGIGK